MISKERMTQSDVEAFANQSLKQDDPGGGTIPDYQQPDPSEAGVTIPDYERPDSESNATIPSAGDPDGAEAEAPVITLPDY
jgi:hypothetical protein